MQTRHTRHMAQPCIRSFMTYKFHDKETFAFLENEAIDGRLGYESFPPAEYKYFSQLAKLGWLNRHNGWAAELCELKQAEHRREYEAAVAERDGWLRHAKQIQSRLLRTTELSRRLNFTRDKDEALDIALELIENLVEEPNLAKRIRKNLKEEQA